MYNSLEPRILTEHCSEQGIDEGELMSAHYEDLKKDMADDLSTASEILKKVN